MRIVFYKMLNIVQNLTIIVFPTILLVTQFNNDYILNDNWKTLLTDYEIIRICSKDKLIREHNITHTITYNRSKNNHKYN